MGTAVQNGCGEKRNGHSEKRGFKRDFYINVAVFFRSYP
jgi:hypothetical protein